MDRGGAAARNREIAARRPKRLAQDVPAGSAATEFRREPLLETAVVEAAGPPRASALISPCAAECSPLPPRFARLVARRQEEGQATEVHLSVGCPSFSAGASEWVA